MNNVIVEHPKGTKRVISKDEFRIAASASRFFDTDVIFIPKQIIHTADFIVGNTRWELKSPIGDSKHTMEHQFERAGKQSQNMILSAKRSKMTMAKFRNQAIYCFRNSNKIKRLIIVDKNNKLQEIKK